MIQFLDTNSGFLMNINWKGITAILIYIFLGIVYLLAHILSRKTECVILWKWYDVTCLFLTVMCPFTICVWLWICSICHLSKEVVLWGGGLMPTIPLTISFSLSVSSNWGHGFISILYIIVSILTKAVLLVFGPIIVLAWFLAKGAGKYAVKDERFRDGTKNNQKTKLVGIALAFFVLLFYPLVFSLVKPKENSEKIKYKLKSLAGI